MAYSKIILNGETLMDVTSDTVTSAKMLDGTTATKNDGTKATGSIATKSAANLTASGSTVTVPAGYYSAQATKNVSAGSAFTPAVTITTNPTVGITSSTGVVTASYNGSSSITPTVTAGYVATGTAGTVSTTGTKTLQLASKAAATYNTSTADQTIGSYQWLTGTQTIKSVTTSNLAAANIASGVTVKVGDANNASRITQVTGTYAPAVSTLTVTPTESQQTFNATGVYGYKPVTVNAISSTYVGTGVAKKSSADTTFASTTGTFTAPIGYYSAAATKTITTQAAQTLYPSTADQTIASYRWLTGTQTIKSVTTSNLAAANIKSGVTVKVGDSGNASRITQVVGTYAPSLISRTVTPTMASQVVTPVAETIVATESLGFLEEGEEASYNTIQLTSGQTYYVEAQVIKDNNTYTGSTSFTYNGSTFFCLVTLSGYDGFIYIYNRWAYINGADGTLSFTISSRVEADGLSQVTVNGDNNLVSENIAEGVSIFGVAGTHSGESSYTATIEGSGDSVYCYVQKDSTKYYTNGNTFEFYEGDTITLYCNNDHIYIDGSSITPSNHSYTFTMPAGEVYIGLFYDTSMLSGNRAAIAINTSSLIYTCTIINNGGSSTTYIQYHGIKYYTDGDTFNFRMGEVIKLYQSSGSIYISGSRIMSMPYPYYTSFGDITVDFDNGSIIKMYTSIIPSGTLSISSNGNYTVYSYISASVNLPYYDVYKRLTYRSSINSTVSSIMQSFFNTLSTIPSYMFEDVKIVGNYSFPICSSLGNGAFCHNVLNNVDSCSFDFPELLRVGDRAFLSQSKMLSINCPKVTSIGYSAFYGCSSLTVANFPSCTIISTYAFYACRSLTTASFPSCTTIGNYAFCNCSSLTTISFPVCDLISNNAFYSCSSLTTVNFPSCTIVGNYAFGNCYSLTTISFPICSLIGPYAFTSCSSLTTINFPSCTSIGSYTFASCYFLTTISFSVCGIISNNAFYSCSSLAAANFPVCNLIGNSAFYGCYLLTTANFPSCTSIGANAFCNCSSLTTISFPACTIISNNAFYNCIALTTANFPSCTSIGTSVFYKCQSLTTIKLPICSSFGTYTFQNCYNLLSFYLNSVSAIPTFGTNMFASTPISTYTTSTGGVRGKIYVPSSLYNTFKTATGWTAYSSLMVSM